jgi:streptogramin lyase
MRTNSACVRPGAVLLGMLALACGGGDGRGTGDDGGTGSISLSVGSLTMSPATEPDTISDSADETGNKFDLALVDFEGGPGDCGPGGMGMGGTNDYSIIWIANSPEGTVSKIDTKTGVELARYFTGPTDGLDDPSRTSVNLEGDVAVANRAGGLTKFASRTERCIDRNGNGTIETSNGPASVLPFTTDECMLWHVDLPYPEMDNTQGPRPTSWDAGVEGDPCVFNDDRLWNGWWERSQNTAYFRRFDGGDGSQLDEVVVPGWDITQSKTYGPYGGATDGEGNFWVTGLAGPLVRIDGDDLSVQKWEVPADSYPYGMTVDANGDPWSAGLNGEIMHFDRATQTFDVYPVMGALGAQSLRGIMIDREGMAWAAANSPCALIQFDTASRLFVNANIALPGCGTPVGVSIDVDGFVWVPDQGANLAYKVDPITYTSTQTMGLIQPYTYSDMTGAGLGLVTNPPAG